MAGLACVDLRSCSKMLLAVRRALPEQPEVLPSQGHWHGRRKHDRMAALLQLQPELEPQLSWSEPPTDAPEYVRPQAIGLQGLPGGG